MSQDNDPPNIYEIPLCTICLRHLANQLLTLACGHTFHAHCIRQHFQYKGSCPNCQKRALDRQLRPLIYPLTCLSSKPQFQVNSFVSNLKNSQKNPFEQIVKQMQKMAKDKIILQKQNKQKQQQISNKNNQIFNYEFQQKKMKQQIGNLKKQNSHLRKQFTKMDERLTIVNKQLLQSDVSILRYKQLESQYERYRKIKSIMFKSSQDIVKLHSQLQNKQMHPQQMIKVFYQMSLMLKLDIARIKQKQNQAPGIIQNKQRQINRLKDTIQKSRNEIKQLREKSFSERKKYEQLKNKFRALQEKYRNGNNNSNDMPQYQDSINVQSKKLSKQFVNEVELLDIQKNIDKKNNVEVRQKFGGFKFGMKNDSRIKQQDKKENNLLSFFQKM